MALSRVKTWQAGEVVTYSDLNNEFNNILDNGAALVSPFTGTVDLNGNTLIIDADADTSIDAATDDQLDITIAGADDFRLTANTLTALSGSSIVVESGNVTITAGNLTVTDGATSIADGDARTNTIATPLTITAVTSDTPAAGIGTGILLRAESADENPSDLAKIAATFSDVTAGSEDSQVEFMTRTAGAALATSYAFNTTSAFYGKFIHVNTANRDWTLPNATTALIGHDTSQTLTNKTIVVGASGATPTANVLYTDSMLKGWVIFQIDGTIDADFNVSSITDNNPGDWTVNWATAFSTANYPVVLTLQSTVTAAGGGIFVVNHESNPTTTACPLRCYAPDGSGQADPTGTRVRMYVMAGGLQ